MNSRTTPNPNGANYISGSPPDKWKFTDNPLDPECETNWNFYGKNGKTLILGNIPNITKEGDTKNWCALKSKPKTPANPNGANYISGSPPDKWKYTDNPLDPECETNWNFYGKDGKTLILGNIPNITKEGDTKNWCALKPRPLSPSPQPSPSPSPSPQPSPQPSPSPSPSPSQPSSSSENTPPSSENTPPSSENTTSSSGNTMLYVIIGIILLLIIVGVVFFKLKKKKTDPMTAFGNRLKKMCKKF